MFEASSTVSEVHIAAVAGVSSPHSASAPRSSRSLSFLSRPLGLRWGLSSKEGTIVSTIGTAAAQSRTSHHRLVMGARRTQTTPNASRHNPDCQLTHEDASRFSIKSCASGATSVAPEDRPSSTIRRLSGTSPGRIPFLAFIFRSPSDSVLPKLHSSFASPLPLLERSRRLGPTMVGCTSPFTHFHGRQFRDLLNGLTGGARRRLGNSANSQEEQLRSVTRPSNDVRFLGLLATSNASECAWPSASARSAPVTYNRLLVSQLLVSTPTLLYDLLRGSTVKYD